jgi:hypothetical protein
MTFCPDIESYDPSLIDRIKFWRRRIPQLLQFRLQHHITYPIKKFLWKCGYIYKDCDLIMELPGICDGVWMRKDAVRKMTENMISTNDIVCANSYTETANTLPWKYEHKEQDGNTNKTKV